MMPLAAGTVRRIAETLAPWRFERIYGAFPGRQVMADGARAAQRSATRYIELLEGSQYRETKAPRLIAMAKILVEKHGGLVPESIEALLELPGLGLVAVHVDPEASPYPPDAGPTSQAEDRAVFQRRLSGES